ncbi:MAG: hypothetical protein OEV55_05690 [candidate division Zixibacteria bacterium]|nr:hypothetical protein [candidate division Zixibacteria bacterium]
MSRLIRLLSILLVFFVLNCAPRAILIERPAPTPTPPPPAKNTGQVIASQNHLTNGKKFYKRVNYGKALQEFNKAIIANPDNWEAHYYAGLCYQKLEHYTESIPEFEICIKFEIPDKLYLSEIRSAFAFSLEKTNDLKEAEMQYNLAYSLNPENNNAYKGMKRVKEKNLKLYKNKKNEKK